MKTPDCPEGGWPVTLFGAEASLCAHRNTTFLMRRRHDTSLALPVVAGSREAPVLLHFLHGINGGFTARLAGCVWPRDNEQAWELRAFFARLTQEMRPHLAFLFPTADSRRASRRVEDAYTALPSEEDRTEALDMGGVALFGSNLIAVEDSVSNAFFGRQAGVATFNVFIRDGCTDVTLTHFCATHHVHTPLTAAAGAAWVLEPV